MALPTTSTAFEAPPCEHCAPHARRPIYDVERLLAAAHAHGDASGVEHEAGDIQEVVRECWKRLTPQAKREVMGACGELLAEWGEGGDVRHTCEGETGDDGHMEDDCG